MPQNTTLTPEERRLALIKTQRETMRVVKRTLLAIALLAGAYYLYLLKTQPEDAPQERPTPNANITDSNITDSGAEVQTNDGANVPQ